MPPLGVKGILLLMEGTILLVEIISHGTNNLWTCSTRQSLNYSFVVTCSAIDINYTIYLVILPSNAIFILM